MISYFRQRTALLPLLLIYFSFIALGLPEGVLGVAMPSILKDFQIQEGDIIYFLIAANGAYLLASFNSGRGLRRFGVPMVVTASCSTAALGLAVYGITPSWWGMVAGGVFAGAGAGIIDASMNTYAAAHYTPRLMSGLHACFGIGATLGPAMTTFFLSMDISWRWSYLSAALAWASVALLFPLLTRRESDQRATAATETPHALFVQTLRLPLAWLQIALFLVYTGVEVTAGQWAFTLLTKGRGVEAELAGMIATLYWGSLTVGRIFFGINTSVDRLGVVNLLRICIGAAVAGAAAFWWNPINAVGFIGLAVLGFALSPIFPMLMSYTPQRLGSQHAPNAIGFQVAAAGLGATLLPGLVGILVENVRVESIAICLFAYSLVMFSLHESVICYRLPKVSD